MIVNELHVQCYQNRNMLTRLKQQQQALITGFLRQSVQKKNRKHTGTIDTFFFLAQVVSKPCGLDDHLIITNQMYRYQFIHTASNNSGSSGFIVGSLMCINRLTNCFISKSFNPLGSLVSHYLCLLFTITIVECRTRRIKESPGKRFYKMMMLDKTFEDMQGWQYMCYMQFIYRISTLTRICG